MDQKHPNKYKVLIRTFENLNSANLNIQKNNRDTFILKLKIKSVLTPCDTSESCDERAELSYLEGLKLENAQHGCLQERGRSQVKYCFRSPTQ